MKNIKSITLGILIGATATLSITALAEYIVVPNSFPVKVNGQTVQVEGYNINDSTYFKLRDVADAVGGFEVGFEDNAIIVNTPNKPTSAPTPTVNPNLSPLPEVEIETVDGVQYVRKSNIEKMLDDIGLGNYEFSSISFYDKTRDDGMALLENIPHHSEISSLIPYSYYTSTIIPIINSLR